MWREPREGSRMNDLRKWRRFWIASNVVLFAVVLLLGQMVESWQGGLTKLIQFYNFMICGVMLVFFLRSDRYGRGIKAMLAAWVILGLILMIAMLLGHWLIGWALLYVLGCFILAGLMAVYDLE